MSRDVYLIGTGPGGMSARAKEVLARCEKTIDLGREGLSPQKAAEAVREAGAQASALLLPGSGLREIAQLMPLLEGFSVTPLPSVRPEDLFAAQRGIPPQEMAQLPPDAPGSALEAAVRTHAYTLQQTDAAKEACALLSDHGLGQLRAAVAEAFGTPQQRVTEDVCAALARRTFGAALLCVQNAHPMQAPLRTCIPDGDFVRGEVPMTKAEVRAAAVWKLRLSPESVVYDIGCGTGSVAVEAALQAKAGRVFAIDKKWEAIALTEQNRRRFGTWNIETVYGEAPQVLEHLPAPDAVFLGGSSGAVEPILETVARKNPHARLVASCASMETLAALSAAAVRFPDAEMVQVSVARTHLRGAHHLLCAQNPVFLFSFTLSGEETC